jgi:DNA-cytosine methyltransferase
MTHALIVHRLDHQLSREACELRGTYRQFCRLPALLLNILLLSVAFDCGPWTRQEMTAEINETEKDSQAMEEVLVVPPRLAKSSYEILIQFDCVARPWHLGGQFGSRTHRISNLEVGIPVLSSTILQQQSAKHEELHTLLETTGVKLITKPFHFPANRSGMLVPSTVDGRIHPERAPADISSPKPTNECSRSLEERPHIGDKFPSFTYAELFAGMGGFGVALEALGGKCIFCSELLERVRDIYQINFPYTPHNRIFGDIYEVTDDELPLPHTLDLLVAGFPCQPFSSLGSQPGLDCPKGRGHLFEEIVRVLQVSKPKAFLLENVPGLLRMKETLDIILHALENCGYRISMEVCDARGLMAQSRKRLYIAGLRCDQSVEQEEPFQFPFVPDLGLRATDILDYDDKSTSEQEYELLRITDEQLQRLRDEKYWKPSHLAWPQGICKTLVSHYGNSISKGESQLVPTVPMGNPRRFSPRECARIMGFPNSYQLPPLISSGAITRDKYTDKEPTYQNRPAAMTQLKQQFSMIGNAVCPPLVSAIAGAILDRCPGIQLDGTQANWVDFGRVTAVRLAREAALCPPNND